MPNYIKLQLHCLLYIKLDDTTYQNIIPILQDKQNLNIQQFIITPIENETAEQFLTTYFHTLINNFSLQDYIKEASHLLEEYRNLVIDYKNYSSTPEEWIKLCKSLPKPTIIV